MLYIVIPLGGGLLIIIGIHIARKRRKHKPGADDKLQVDLRDISKNANPKTRK